jgi:hypothetical protein
VRSAFYVLHDTIPIAAASCHRRLVVIFQQQPPAMGLLEKRRLPYNITGTNKGSSGKEFRALLLTPVVAWRSAGARRPRAPSLRTATRARQRGPEGSWARPPARARRGREGGGGLRGSCLAAEAARATTAVPRTGRGAAMHAAAAQRSHGRSKSPKQAGPRRQRATLRARGAGSGGPLAYHKRRATAVRGAGRKCVRRRRH